MGAVRAIANDYEKRGSALRQYIRSRQRSWEGREQELVDGISVDVRGGTTNRVWVKLARFSRHQPGNELSTIIPVTTPRRVI